MSYLHKYTVDGHKVFVMTENQSKPASTLSLRQKDWEGRALGRVNTVLSQINKLKFTQEEKPEEPKEVTEKRASIVAELDKMASDLEADGQTQVAYALDQVSDFLDPTKE